MPSGAPTHMKTRKRSGRRAPHGAQIPELFGSMPRQARRSQIWASLRDAGKVAGGELRSGAAPGYGKHRARAPAGATEIFRSQIHSVAPPGLLIRFRRTPGCAALARGYCLQPFQGWNHWHIVRRTSLETVSAAEAYFATSQIFGTEKSYVRGIVSAISL
jgi:hypothetical protein